MTKKSQRRNLFFVLICPVLMVSCKDSTMHPSEPEKISQNAEVRPQEAETLLIEQEGPLQEPRESVEITQQGHTVGGGAIETPAIGPSPAYDYGNDTAGYVLVKNWDFGTNGTIKSNSDLSEHFQFHDQFGCIMNGKDNYGAMIVAPDKANAITSFGIKQPVEGINTDRPVREYLEDSMKTYLVGLDGDTEVHPTSNKGGCGSLQAKWTLPAGGKLLGKDMIFETRVRYKTPPYFWFAIWTAGNKWSRGAEMDVIESFGYDNGGDHTNFDGAYWHSSLVEGKDGQRETEYKKSWGAAMKKYGITEYDATEYHTWTWVYKADDTFIAYVDGIPVQRGSTPWTYGAENGGEPINMSFIFDGGWGHKGVASVNKALPVSEFDDKFYEWDYSRVYLRDPTIN